jgi:hypothetical protein
MASSIPVVVNAEMKEAASVGGPLCSKRGFFFDGLCAAIFGPIAALF